ARHAGGEVAAGGAEDDHAAAGHVLAAVVADRQHDCVDAAVADAKTFAGHAANVGFAAGGAVEGDVADDHVLADDKGSALGRVDDNLAARQAFADVIVRIDVEDQGDATRPDG